MTLYHSRVEDEIIRTRPPAGPDVTQNADGRTVHQGIEAAAEFDLLPQEAGAPFHLAWLTVVNVNDFRFDGDPQFGSSRLPAVPVVVAQSELMARLQRGWYAAAGVEWAPEGMYVDYANTLRTDGYAVASVRAGRRVAGGLNLFVALENVFDKDYVSSVAPQSGLNNSVSAETSAVFPGQGRRWQAGVEYRF